MEASKENIYFFIETMRRHDYNGTDIYTLLKESWPDECISVQRVRKILKEFEDGRRDSFERKDGSGRKKSDARQKNVDNVKRLLEENSCITVREISEHLDISQTMAYNIMYKDLEHIWHHTKWVPHTLSEANKVLRVARSEDLLVTYDSRLSRSNLVTIDEKCFYCRHLQPRNKIGNWLSETSAQGDEPVRHTARRSPMEKKFMAIVAVSQRGDHYFEMLELNEHVNAERYIQFLKRMEAYFKNLQNPILAENMRLQQDNARPHTAQRTMAYLEERNIRLVRQPAYSPDMNLLDRYIFPRLEAARPKVNFASLNDIQDFISRELPNFTANRMNKALDDLIVHLRKVIGSGGKYVTN